MTVGVCQNCWRCTADVSCCDQPIDMAVCYGCWICTPMDINYHDKQLCVTCTDNEK